MTLEQLRAEIDRIDDSLIDFLQKRMEMVKKIGILKQQSNSIIYRPEREKNILERLYLKSQNTLLPPQAIESIFMEIFATSRNIEMPEYVAYLGPEGSFTHQAAEYRFGAMSRYIPQTTISAVFKMVNTKRSQYGVIAIENNQEGVIKETIEMLKKSDVKIVAEIPIPIHHSLASHTLDIRNIKTLYSKDIAFAQCSNFIRNTWAEKDIELVYVASTSLGCKMASERENTAAICSHIAAKLYKVPVVFENIEDSENNFTRFLIIGKENLSPPTQSDKTSIIATLEDKPGTLATFLQDFYHNDISLCKIESYPSKESSRFQYFFFIDFEGHYKDEKVAAILKKYEQNIKHLGSYIKLC
ncbi:MAG: prephenate dehydratase [Chitinophagaceae bacterium]|nr:prephenate dehydratase [Chitinophagaceae bacterium]